MIKYNKILLVGEEKNRSRCLTQRKESLSPSKEVLESQEKTFKGNEIFTMDCASINGLYNTSSLYSRMRVRGQL